jgi:sulfur-oxidizing protein SoxZ
MSSIKIRLKRFENTTLVRMLISHPMETGRRTDKQSGNLIPAHHIRQLSIVHKKRTVALCNLGPGIAADPYFAFRFREGKPGDVVTISWIDNHGVSDSATAIIP